MIHDAVALAALCMLATAAPGRTQHPEQPQPRDAAPGYREAIRLARDALEVPDDDILFPPEPASDTAIGDELRGTLYRLDGALAAFRAAAALPTCRFAPAGSTPPFDEFFDRRVELHALATLIALDGRRALEDGAPARAVADLGVILGWSRHAFGQTSASGVMFAHAAERTALELAARLAPAGGAPATDAREVLRAHAARRPGLAVVEPAARVETLRIVDAFLHASAEDADDELAGLLRPLAVGVRKSADELIAAALAPIDAAVKAGDAEPLAECSRIARQWKADIPKDRARIAAMDEAERTATLAKLLVLLALPDVESLGREHLEIGAALATAAR